MGRLGRLILAVTACSAQQQVHQTPPFVRLYGDESLGNGELAAQLDDGRVFSCSVTSEPTPSSQGCLHEVRELAGATSITIAADGRYCASMSDGTVRCATCHPFGFGCSTWVAPLDGLTGVAAVFGSCAIRHDGVVTCWDGSAPPAPAPVSQLSCGYVVLENGGLYDPVSMTTVLDNVVHISCGIAFFVASEKTTCATSASGELYCWGSNINGRIGDGSVTDRATPTLIGTNYADVAVSIYSSGATASCGLRRDGSVWCWGRGTGSLVFTPVAMTGLVDISQLVFALPADPWLSDDSTNGFYALKSNGAVIEFAPGSPPSTFELGSAH